MGEVTSQIIKLSHIVRTTNHECIQMRRLQSNVLRIAIELGNTCKVEQVDKVDEIGKLDKSQNYPQDQQLPTKATSLPL